VKEKKISQVKEYQISQLIHWDIVRFSQVFWTYFTF
jgi:hypothetical protein